MPSTYLERARSVASPETARIALFIDADHFRRCAARRHEQLTGLPTSPDLVNIDGAGISEWVQRAALELGLEGSGEPGRGRSSRRVYDVLHEDRRRRWRQRHYHGVLEAEGCIVKVTRARPGRRAENAVAAQLAADLVRLTRNRQLDAALLIVGDGAYPGAVVDARRHGAEVILLIPAASGALVAESLALTASRAIALHPEVFETLYQLRS